MAGAVHRVAGFGAGVAGHLAGDFRPETDAEHACRPDQADAFRRQAGEPGEQELLVRMVGAPLPHVADGIVAGEDRRHLLQPEGIARAELPGLRDDVARELAADQLGEQEARRQLGERGQRDHLGVSVVGEGGSDAEGVGWPRAQRGDHGHRQRLDAPGQERE